LAALVGRGDGERTGALRRAHRRACWRAPTGASTCVLARFDGRVDVRTGVHRRAYRRAHRRAPTSASTCVLARSDERVGVRTGVHRERVDVRTGAL